MDDFSHNSTVEDAAHHLFMEMALRTWRLIMLAHGQDVPFYRENPVGDSPFQLGMSRFQGAAINENDALFCVAVCDFRNTSADLNLLAERHGGGIALRRVGDGTSLHEGCGGRFAETWHDIAQTLKDDVSEIINRVIPAGRALVPPRVFAPTGIAPGAELLVRLPDRAKHNAVVLTPEIRAKVYDAIKRTFTPYNIEQLRARMVAEHRAGQEELEPEPPLPDALSADEFASLSDCVGDCLQIVFLLRDAVAADDVAVARQRLGELSSRFGNCSLRTERYFRFARQWPALQSGFKRLAAELAGLARHGMGQTLFTLGPGKTVFASAHDAANLIVIGAILWVRWYGTPDDEVPKTIPEILEALKKSFRYNAGAGVQGKAIRLTLDPAKLLPDEINREKWPKLLAMLGTRDGLDKLTEQLAKEKAAVLAYLKQTEVSGAASGADDAVPACAVGADGDTERTAETGGGATPNAAETEPADGSAVVPIGTREQPTFADEAWLSPAEVQKQFPHLTVNAVGKQLKRWRRKNDDGWREVTERKPREAQYLYRWGNVRMLFGAASETAGQRRAK
jgi:hypothetical protein